MKNLSVGLTIIVRLITATITNGLSKIRQHFYQRNLYVPLTANSILIDPAAFEFFPAVSPSGIPYVLKYQHLYVMQKPAYK